ncbi:MAG: Prenyltransferase/squalene oxidase [Candidatus Nomurabacteria bacterium GW2011_GWF2_35_12]|uniref:Prenyltransferase/squalene oxidase n=1 Tax=Candidatus Nomurabacteria bacterium GW2011_GWA1_36_15 TaxID=1618728 RepID=A0A0G0H162_9BACT|nr:MAG: Prenyltransferase/squalene oxidase [Candidatus Nomurabacteria bacterium GW2011_GWF2_35_12]KKP76310.1 MAG: Prenyltransferase/squalene oxidase [Parcubacteria group bacterium GW2011_GWC1_35_21]KKP77501.1 MAG: Prenyltransferase/squalene oxidase [Candidatus Nomurabacteria bacterium GW2011_GWC2_35_35]KKP97647.1 MAG: Prenyltransferase/squalene oxidase [Candidatus Nomurabacteria bacterium GW2011_GWA1_36_15]
MSYPGNTRKTLTKKYHNMRNIKKILQTLFILALFLTGTGNVVYADISLTIRDGNTKIFEGAVPLQATGTIDLNDNTGTSHSIDAQSVLSLINDADILSADFSISDLEYYSSFGSLYLKCITGTIMGEKCDNWQYTVNNTYPGIGMDQKVLSDGENVYLYFGPQYKITLNSNSITISDTLTATAQEYDYQNDAWIMRTGVTVGLTQPNPENPWTPTEIQTAAVDANSEANFSSIPEGSYNVGIKEDFYFPTETLTVTAAPASDTGSSSSSSSSGSRKNKNTGSVLGIETKVKFDLEKAFESIILQQKENGSFGENLYTDWTAIALAGGNYQNQTIKLIKYFTESKFEDGHLTDYERHAMALMALGLNPYNTNNENYIKKITDSFDGKQFGDTNQDNDDIFALIILQNAGFTQSDKIIADDISFILNRQKENGSWDENIDMTGAGMQAIAFFNQNEWVANALVKAREFLKQNQKNDGGWGNVSSTAWAIGGIWALSEKPENWIKNDNTPLDYLAINQDTDGGIKNLPAGEEGESLQNKIWETAYAITALSGKTWNQIMQKFEKLEEESISPPIEKKMPTKITAKEATPKKQKINSENLPSQNTATVINAITENKEEILPIKKGWFRNLLEKIFNIF